jgi:hypothetical protein
MFNSQQLRAWATSGRVRAAGWVLAAACLGLLFRYAMGPLFVGPSDWDDTMYVDRAITTSWAWDVRNRYIHVWAIRITDMLVDGHRVAAACWGTLCVCGLAGLSYFAGTRISGVRCGLLAMLLVVLFPPMLKYLSVPHIDFSMALFSMLSVLAAVAAAESRSVSISRAAAMISGLSCYLALKSKETALVIPPLVLYVLFGARRSRLQVYVEWFSGLLIGFALLRGLEETFASEAEHRSSDPAIYFARAPESSLPILVPKLRSWNAELLAELSRPQFAGFAWLGLAGFARKARYDPWVRALGLWCLGVLAFTALVSWRSTKIDAQDRYLIAVGAALAPLAASRVMALWQAPSSRDLASLLWLIPLLLALVGPAIWGLWGTYFDAASESQARALRVVTPLAMLMLFLTAWLTTQKLVSAPAAMVLLGMSALVSVGLARDHRAEKTRELQPWVELSRLVDNKTVSRIAVLQGRTYRANRLRWRLRVFSRHRELALELRDIRSADDIAAGEWVFVGAARMPVLEERRWHRVVGFEGAERPWSVYQAPPDRSDIPIH